MPKRNNSKKYSQPADSDSFIRKPHLLEETPKIDKDLLGFEKIKERFRDFLEKIDKNAVVSLLGPFGSGKSTLLHLLEKDHETNPDVKWITFDSWKYPDKKDLWKGFIFDFIKQTNRFL